MRRLNKRTRTDTHKNDRRVVRKGYGRWIYLTLLAALFIGVLDYIWGDAMLFRAKGVVSQERVDIEARYVGHLDNFSVQLGQEIRKGQIIGRISSMEVTDRLAELKLRQSELKDRVIENEETIKIARELLPIAEQRLKDSREMRQVANRAKAKGLVTTDRLLEVYSENNAAEEAIIRIQEELKSDISLQRSLKDSLEDVDRALSELTMLYSDGYVLSPVTGVLGSSPPVRGQTFLTGENILSVYTGEKYIQAYLPSRHLFPVEVGETVLVYAGATALEGVVEEILPISDDLPKQFQNSFKPAERSQLANIRVENLDLPLHTKITLRRKNETLRGWGRKLGVTLAGLWNSNEPLKHDQAFKKRFAQERIDNVFRAIELAGGASLQHDQTDVRRVSLSLR